MYSTLYSVTDWLIIDIEINFKLRESWTTNAATGKQQTAQKPCHRWIILAWRKRSLQAWPLSHRYLRNVRGTSGSVHYDVQWTFPQGRMTCHGWLRTVLCTKRNCPTGRTADVALGHWDVKICTFFRLKHPGDVHQMQYLDLWRSWDIHGALFGCYASDSFRRRLLNLFFTAHAAYTERYALHL